MQPNTAPILFILVPETAFPASPEIVGCRKQRFRDLFIGWDAGNAVSSVSQNILALEMPYL